MLISFLPTISPVEDRETQPGSLSVSVYSNREERMPNVELWMDSDGQLRDRLATAIDDCDLPRLMECRKPEGGKIRPLIVLLIVTDTKSTALTTLAAKILTLTAASDPQASTIIYIAFQRMR